MDLTAERFARLINSLSARRGTERNRENRTEQRGGVRYRLTIKVPGNRTTAVVRAWLRDFSGTGLGMTTSVPITVGQAFAIQMQSAAGLMDIPCTTAYCQRAAEDVYVIGARFTDRWFAKIADAA
ncbi:MAG TPA: PilZ domain-containing protein [Tepidisphaeraceae bacterium]|jgi:hypothetical protein|nr:PilZ domain-containing protein [Tepidisphaeraceae bacterium]